MTETDRKVVIISGGTNGIGQAADLAFSREGYAVTLADSNKETLGSIADEIISQEGDALLVEADVFMATNVRRVIERTVSTFGGVDVLFVYSHLKTTEGQRICRRSYGTASCRST